MRSEPGPIAGASAETTTGERRRLFVEFVAVKRLVCKNGHLLPRPACSMRYRSPHVSSSPNDYFKKFTTFIGARLRRPHHSHGFSHGRQNRMSSFCSGRGEKLVTIARFGKPLFANMHHRNHAVAGDRGSQMLHALTQKSPLWMAKDVIDAEFALCRCQCVDLSSTERIFFCICTNFFAKNVPIDFKCIENHCRTPHS